MDCSSSKVKMSSPDSEPETAAVPTNSNVVLKNVFKDVHFTAFKQIAASSSTWESSGFAELQGAAKVEKQAWAQTTSRGGPTRFRKHLNPQHRNVAYARIGRRIFTAAITNNTEYIEEMLSKGHSPNILDDRGCTPLHIAAGRGFADVVRILLSHGARPNAINHKGHTPLHLAVKAVHNVAVVTILLEAGSSILTKDKFNRNALQLAHNKLRIYCNYTADDFDQGKQEIHSIIKILLLFLKKQGAHEEEMLTLGSQICQLDTSDHLQNDVKNLLAKLDTLNIEG